MRFTHFPPIIILLISVGLVASGFALGRYQPIVPTEQQAGTGSISLSTASQPSQLNFGLFWEAWDKVTSRFFGETADTQLIEGAIQGMVGSLGDPYTTYLDPEAAKELGDGLQGIFSGIGAEIGVKDRRLVVIAPLVDSPAAKAGLKSEDEIQKIDSQAVGDLSFTEAIRKIRGKDGTQVILTVLHSGQTEPVEIAVTRGQIVVKSVASSVRPDNFGYLKVSAFHEDTAKLVGEALAHFTQEQVQGVILDLRGNPGGLLDQGIDVASYFLTDGVVVKQKAKDGQVKTFSVSLRATAPKLPLVVLIDKGSASASEIVAGALQDHERAILIGETSFGKGSVQELTDLSNGGQIKVTIAQWLTPSDRMINGKGIEPDIAVSLSDEDEAAGQDPQLDRALEELKK